MDEFTVHCSYCPGSPQLVRSVAHEAVSLVEWRKAWKRFAPTYRSIACPQCFAAYRIADDGAAAESGGGVEVIDRSAPIITGLNTSAGPRTGGGFAVIFGNALDIGSSLVVKFGGQACATVDQRTQTTARVVVPPALYTLNVAEHTTILTLAPVSGLPAVGETVVTEGGSTGTVRAITGADYSVGFASRVENFDAMVGRGLTCGSGVYATVTAARFPALIPGEVVYGLNSAAQGVLASTGPVSVRQPSGGFAPNELVRGVTSGALIKLSGSPAYSGVVDVSVENEHGQRVGSTLVGAYTYA